MPCSQPRCVPVKPRRSRNRSARPVSTQVRAVEVAQSLAGNSKAKIVAAKDVESAKKLVDEKKWDDKSEACGQAPSLIAALGLKHPNLSSGTVTVACEGDKCVLNVDLERHGRHSKDRWVRYTAPLKDAKDKIKVATIQAAKLKANGVPPDAPKAGLEVGELAPGMRRAASPAGKAFAAASCPAQSRHGA